MFDKLKGLLIQEEDTPVPVKETPKSAPVAQHAQGIVLAPGPATLSPVVMPQQPSMALVAAENGKMKEKLKEALVANVEGTPYSMFLKIMEVMKTQIVDPSTRTIAVGASLAAQAVSKTQLLQAAQTKGVDFLNGELAAFESDINEEINNISVATETKVKQLEDDIRAKREQQDQLAKDIIALGQQRDETLANAIGTKSKLEFAKIEFGTAHKTLLTEVQSDIESITKYITGV